MLIAGRIELNHCILAESISRTSAKRRWRRYREKQFNCITLKLYEGNESEETEQSITISSNWKIGTAWGNLVRWQNDLRLPILIRRVNAGVCDQRRTDWNLDGGDSTAKLAASLTPRQKKTLGTKRLRRASGRRGSVFFVGDPKPSADPFEPVGSARVLGARTGRR
jgi:hypothetical protein